MARPISLSNYGTPQGLSTPAPRPVIAKRAPTTSDVGYQLGQLWVYELTANVYALGQVSGGSATWTILGGGSGAVSSLSGDTGVATPTAGNIKVAGTAGQIAVNGSGSTLTASIPTSYLIGNEGGSDTGFLLAGSGGMTINVGEGGPLTIGSAGGNVTIDSGIGALGISTDASTTTVSIATGAAPKTVSLGSTSSTSTTTIQSGSGGIVLAGSLSLVAAGPQILFGAGSPSLTAPQGSLYINTTGATTTTRLYINESGSTTWASFTTSA